MTTTPVIAAQDLVKRWGSNTVLDRLTFDVVPGVTGLLGANGAGKTTLLGMILGLHRADSGRLEVFGLAPNKSGADVRARIGYSPEHHNLPPDLRAHDFVRHVAEIHGLPPREAQSRASDALYHVGLGEERFRPLGTMSTGQRQRVKLAQAMAHDPSLLLLDEPTDGLDPVQREDMLHLISRIGREFGISVLLSSHLLDEVERVCDHAVILADGALRASGRISDLTKGTGALVLEVDDRAEEVADALRRIGAEVTVDARLLTVHLGDRSAEHGLHDEHDLNRVTRDVLADLGVGVLRLHAGRRSLEDLFFEMGVV